ncbi:MAG TPA: MFS transporter, partial [Armatimonadota bacterium]
ATPAALTPSVTRAVKLTYAQSMLGAVFAASTGGMFLIGYALKLGADNVRIGLLSTVPMCCVVMQLVSAALIEHGVSRRKMTIVAMLLSVLGWALAIAIPVLARGPLANWRVEILIAIIALVTLMANMANNARASWVGDLIPESFRNTFFGRIIMYGSIIGVVFALVEGRFLDVVKSHGVGAFGLLFGFGMLFGLATVLLFLPQPDAPLARHASGGRFFILVKETFANRPLMIVLLFALLWSLQTMAGPFYATYMLRDLGMPFLGVGIVNAVTALVMIACSPFWGRIIDRYGCRPVLVASTFAIVPLPLVWIWMTSPLRIYLVVLPLNILVGFAIAGFSVALNTLIYKVTSSTGRSVQLAVYSILVTLAAAPMPVLGGLLPKACEHFGLHTDLRVTFLATIPLVLLAGLAALRIPDPASCHTRDLVRALPGHLCRPKSVQ